MKTEKDPEVQELLKQINQANPRSGFCIGNGWFPIVKQVLLDITALQIPWELIQIKSKFCQLRIYYEVAETGLHDNSQIVKIINKAELVCNLSCENCGKPHGLETPRSGAALCKSCQANWQGWNKINFAIVL